MLTVIPASYGGYSEDDIVEPPANAPGEGAVGAKDPVRDASDGASKRYPASSCTFTISFGSGFLESLDSGFQRIGSGSGF